MVDPYPSPIIIDLAQPSPRPPTPSPPEGPSVLEKVWSFVRRYILAPIPILILVVGAALLVALGVKNVQVGGLIGKLLGKKVAEKAIDVANSVPPERVDEEGALIPPGTPDLKGLTQAQVVPIDKPGLLSDPKTIKVTPPGTTKSIEVAVPDGVKAKDVEQVVIINHKITGVTVRSESAVTAQEVDDLLAKYDK